MFFTSPVDELERIQTLDGYEVLDSPEEAAFDDLVCLAAKICETPVALISLVDRDRQWFKARFGLEARETPREQSICAQAILQSPEPLVVEDALADPRFRDHPLVHADPPLRFYAGVPLVAPSGVPLGALCVTDQVPRRLRADQMQGLQTLAHEVMSQLELRRKTLAMDKLVQQYQAVMDTLVEGVFLRDAHGRLLAYNPSVERLLGTSLASSIGRDAFDHVEFVGEDGQPLPLEHLPSLETLRTGHGRHGVVLGVRVEGGIRWLQANTCPLFQAGGDSPAGVVVSFWDLSERKRLEDRLREEATHDGLTGLSNRRALEERLPQAMAAAARHAHPLSLCACDLDHFKALNDTHGHAAGDSVLRAFARAMRTELRAEDLPARLGGDEFCILFEGITSEQAVQSLERIRKAFAASEKPLGGSQVTATFGLSDWRPGLDPEAFQAEADEALYRAKAQGRNCVQLFQP